MATKPKNKYIKRLKTTSRHTKQSIIRAGKTWWAKWIILPIISIGILAMAIITISYVAFPPVKSYNFGVSFSARQADEFGVDWQDNFTALLDDLQIRKYRLMSYWNEHESTRGQFDFSRLDWQMDEAAKRGAQVSLAIGERQPRWPECHTPSWATSLEGHEWRQALYAYIEVVVNRYEDHPALESFQLENEYFNAGFGECDPPDRERFYEEYALVKSITDKPVWTSLADQHGLPLRGTMPDAYGYSVYRYVYNDKIIPGYMWYPTPQWYHHFRTALIKIVRPDAKFYIHELQLEPWGPSHIRDISIAEQDRSMSYDQIHENVTFTRQIGFDNIYTWGGEWWYWRKTVKNDPSVWDAVQREIDISKRTQ